MQNHSIPGIKSVPMTGVIYAMHQASQHGYTPFDTEWVNLGQGAPEVGEIPGAPARISQITIPEEDHEYGPVAGDQQLRQRIADFYNHFYRKDKDSQYDYRNIGISGGGRLALTRISAALDTVHLGHMIPDYTAYEELLNVFKDITPIPILVSPETDYRLDPMMLEQRIREFGLQVFLMSNPCNPTGQLVAGDDLKQYLAVAREYKCTFIFDEFYSHYIYNGTPRGMVSAAEYVEDVNTDPVIIVDGLTKNWRYPGWRLSWTVGPADLITALMSAGSFMDGGPNHPLQSSAQALLAPEHVMQETTAIQRCFAEKRDYMLKRIRTMGIEVEVEPQGTFYLWAHIAQLPQPLNDGMQLFQRLLKEKVITVPGVFFDVNPGKRRPHERLQTYTRLSFGPDIDSLKCGLDRLEKCITQHS